MTANQLPTDAIRACIQDNGYATLREEASEQLQALRDAVAEKDKRIAMLEARINIIANLDLAVTRAEQAEKLF